MIPPTPKPTYGFDTGTGANQISIGGSPADANIAVSSTHICVTARAAFGCYTKGGTLVSPGPGLDARPYTAEEFFTNSGIPLNPTFNSVGTTTKDGRVVFDRYRKRFFMVFQSREAQGRLLIAVSKSEDPRDGWWTYADLVANAQANTHDYQKIGYNASHLLVSDLMANCVKNAAGKWICTGVGTRHFMYTANELVVGKPYSRSEWSDPSANGAAPCVHDSYTTDAFWVQRDDNTHASVWAIRGGNVTSITSKQVTIQASTDAVDGTQLGGNTVIYDQFGGAPPPPLNPCYRNDRIVFVSNDGHTWSGQLSRNNAARLVRLNVSKYFAASPSVKVEIDRIFGRASADDPSGSIFDYGWPAAAVNASGDIVVGSVRSNSTIYPELRASVWFAGQPDIGSSISLQKSSSPLSAFHMAGVCADPSTDGIYLAQQYGSSSPSWRIHVAKMLGEVMADVIATQVQSPATIAHGASGNVTVTVMNQGDGPIPASTGGLYLSTDNSISLLGPDIQEDPLLASFSVPALAPNQVVTIPVPFTMAATQAPGNYFVGVALYNSTNEYSESNNVNPFLVGNHGNAPITVK